MIETAELVPGQLLRADRPMSPTSASDLPLAGGTAATFDVQLGSLPTLALGVGVPGALVASGAAARGEEIAIENAGSLPVGLSIGGEVSTTAVAEPGAYPFATAALGGVAGITAAPSAALPIALFVPGVSHLAQGAATPGSGGAPAPVMDSPIEDKGVTPEVVQAMAADVATAMQALANAMTSLSSGAEPQSVATTIAAVQAGLANLARGSGDAVDAKLAETIDATVAATTDTVAAVGDTASDLLVDTATTAVTSVDALADTATGAVADVATTVTTTVGAAAEAATGAVADVATALTTTVDAVALTTSDTLAAVTTNVAGTVDAVAGTTTGTVAQAASTAATTATALTATAAETVTDTLAATLDAAPAAIDNLTDLADPALAGADPAAGVATLVDLVQSDDGFAIEGLDGGTIFASAGSALGEAVDGDLLASVADTTLDAPLLDDHAAGLLTGVTDGLLGGLNWDHDHG